MRLDLQDFCDRHGLTYPAPGMVSQEWIGACLEIVRFAAEKGEECERYLQAMKDAEKSPVVVDPRGPHG